VSSGKSIQDISREPATTAYSFSNDGKWFAAGLADGTVELRPLASDGKIIKWQPTKDALDVVQVISNDIVVIAPHEQPGQVWQMSSPTPTLKANLPTDFSGLTFVASSPDGRLLVAGGTDTVVRAYDTTSWKLIHDYRKFTLEPFAGAFTADGRYFLVGGADNRITVFDTKNGAEFRKLPASPDVVAEIRPLSNNTALAVQWDVDGKNPPYLATWDLDKGTVQKITAPQPITGGGVVKGEPWFTSASAKELKIWTSDTSAGK
jgi:WD40 repeat protein